VNYKRLACYEDCPGTFGYIFVVGRIMDPRYSPEVFHIFRNVNSVTTVSLKKNNIKHHKITLCCPFK
jgi:hypothetical protein